MKITKFNSNSDTGLQHALRDWLRGQDWKTPFAATLSLKQRRGSDRIDQVKASQNVRHFANVLNRRCLGSAAKRHSRRVPMFTVIEGGGAKRLHVHAVIECPRGDLTASFADHIRDAWRRTDWGYHQMDVRPCDEGWLTYITKLRDKPDFAISLDWQNCQLTEQSRCGWVQTPATSAPGRLPPLIHNST